MSNKNICESHKELYLAHIDKAVKPPIWLAEKGKLGKSQSGQLLTLELKGLIRSFFVCVGQWSKIVLAAATRHVSTAQE